ncbi:hypothetical protein C2845_PM12G01350 [Panicum miliaceum]|uniref:(3S,6E)-nerolidol synthase 1-like n=1 Tax=Panicum miliaceum TaxID=4540 RepID=A0A3L6QIJ2_PANMI|nr:hypothetical protein C2845_PM12G01350 [Panicum miliaceum]
MMAAVDNLKRLCIDHYFEEEIESAMAVAMDLVHSDDLLDATLSFRLMRETGHDVSADDVLRRFTTSGGEFSLALTKDILGLLSLHDMSHLNIGEEASLHRAKEFSTKHLASAMRNLEPAGLALYVRQSLDHPYHLSLMQYKARHHLRYLQSLRHRNTTAMEELAVAEFQLNKLLHQKEMVEIKRWWMDLGLAQGIPVARDQVLKWYTWSMTILQGSSFSRYRVEITKIIAIAYVVDDIFDLVGTLEELSLFTQAIKTWDIAAASSLPSCMSLFLFFPLKWGALFDGFMVQAKWLATDQGIIVMQQEVTPQSSPTTSLWDDMGSAKDEAQEGLDGSYRELYLAENPAGDAEEHMRRLIAREWEELNRECFSRRTFSGSFARACFNAARMVSVMYSYDEEQRLPVLEDYMRMLLL